MNPSFPNAWQDTKRIKGLSNAEAINAAGKCRTCQGPRNVGLPAEVYPAVADILKAGYCLMCANKLLTNPGWV